MTAKYHYYLFEGILTHERQSRMSCGAMRFLSWINHNFKYHEYLGAGKRETADNWNYKLTFK